jgi:uncharacterized protein YndB with AHSA1/START domain
VTYGFRIERVIDAPPTLVFDVFVGSDSQRELFDGAVEGWQLWEFEIDLRVGGTWRMVFGPADRSGDPDRITYVLTEVDPPHRLAYDGSMYVSEWGRTVEYSETITFEDRDGSTLVAIEARGFASEEESDAFKSGTPTFLDALQRVVATRVAQRGRTS